MKSETKGLNDSVDLLAKAMRKVFHENTISENQFVSERTEKDTDSEATYECQR